MKKYGWFAALLVVSSISARADSGEFTYGYVVDGFPAFQYKYRCADDGRVIVTRDFPIFSRRGFERDALGEASQTCAYYSAHLRDPALEQQRIAAGIAGDLAARAANTNDAREADLREERELGPSCAEFWRTPTAKRWDGMSALKSRCGAILARHRGTGQTNPCREQMSEDQAEAYRLSRQARKAQKAGDTARAHELYASAQAALDRFHAQRRQRNPLSCVSGSGAADAGKTAPLFGPPAPPVTSSGGADG
jgi:hypothetical protein